MKSSTKVIIGVVVVALIGAGVYFGNTTLQKGSFRGFPARPTGAPSPATAPTTTQSDFLIEYTFPLDPALPPGWCKLETGQSINFVNNSNEPIVVSRLGIYLKGDGFGTFSLGNFSLKSPETEESLKYVYSYSSTLKNPGIIYFDLSPQALKPQNLPLVVIQPKSKAHYWVKATGQPIGGVLASGSTITGKFSFSPAFARYSSQLAVSGTPEKTFAPLPKDYKWKDLQVCITANATTESTPSTSPPPPSGSPSGSQGSYNPPPQSQPPGSCPPNMYWDFEKSVCMFPPPASAAAEKSTPPAVACEPGKSLCSATGTKCMTHNECAAAEKEPTPASAPEPAPAPASSPEPVCPANQSPCQAAGNQCMTQGMCEEITEAE